MNVIRGFSLTHRWLGVIFCLFFAMWFLTGWVMHFVQFPTLSAQEKFAGLSPLQLNKINISPVKAESIANTTAHNRVRLVMRGDRPEYIFESGKQRIGIFADNGERANTTNASEALALANIHARNRGLDSNHITYVTLEDYDQWTVTTGFNPHRPLHRIKLNDSLGTELYVSSVTGEVLRDTTRFERGWNYAGSVLHWIYPTVLRKHGALWNDLVWWLAAIALVSAVSGTVLGLLRVRWKKGVKFTPFKRFYFWHHVLGLGCALFLLSYIFSGWLSMDRGLLFSTNDISADEKALVSGGNINLQTLENIKFQTLPNAKEIDFLPLNGRTYIRVKSDYNQQQLFDQNEWSNPFFDESFFTLSTKKLSTQCGVLTRIAKDDNYFVNSNTPNSPVFRIKCEDKNHTWFHIDSATGQLIEKIDNSRRWYRWLYSGLHTWDFHWLLAHSWLRSLLVSVFCCTGLIFSITGIVIGWRRLRHWVA
jgi:hypothetical protein